MREEHTLHADFSISVDPRMIYRRQKPALGFQVGIARRNLDLKLKDSPLTISPLVREFDTFIGRIGWSSYKTSKRLEIVRVERYSIDFGPILETQLPHKSTTAPGVIGYRSVKVQCMGGKQNGVSMGSVGDSSTATN